MVVLVAVSVAIMAALLMIACFSYLVDALALFLAPEAGEAISPFVLAPAAVGELWMVGHLLVKGVRAPRPVRPAPVAA